MTTSRMNRRRWLALSLAGCLAPPPGTGAASAGAPQPASGANSFGFMTWTTPGGDPPMRRFAGKAAPPRSYSTGDGAETEVHGHFPNARCPFAIDTRIELGKGGWGLETPDRGVAGILPATGDSPWQLNMIPFGVLVDGSILDPSGPWYDGGPADPDNPFDRNCTGWEYEVNHPAVMDLVGVPEKIRGHVQPSGMFHYHGYPTAMIAALRRQTGSETEPLLVGYSADGYPVIDCDLSVAAGRAVVLHSGHVPREGERAAQPSSNPDFTPPGLHDGLFVQDYLYDRAAAMARLPAGSAHRVLDGLNGIVLGDDLPGIDGYPDRHYAYVLTREWPFIPRGFRFLPDESFRRIIPLVAAGLGQQAASLLGLFRTRSELYANCPAPLRHVRLAPDRSVY